MRKKYAFDVDKAVSYWLESAKYELGVANVTQCSRSGNTPYALFMGHLALEKLLKALVVKRTKAHAPFTHSLPFLLEKSGIKMPEPMKIWLSEFMEFHLEARYPDASRAFYRKCTNEYADARLKEIKKVFRWIKTKL